MTETLHPPYGIPNLREIGEDIKDARDHQGLYNLHVTTADVDGRYRLNLTATFWDSHYGPKGGIDLALYWTKPPGVDTGDLMIRVGDKAAYFPGPRGTLNEIALGLWDLGDSLIDFIPEAIRTLGTIHEEMTEAMNTALRQASD
jgi:hypothetical protein